MREGRTPFIRRSIYFESRTEGRAGPALKEGVTKRKKTYAFPPSRPSLLVIIFHDKG